MTRRWFNSTAKIMSLFLVMLNACSPTSTVVRNSEELKSVKTILIVPFKSLKIHWGQNLAQSIATNLPMSRFTVLKQHEAEKLLDSLGLSMAQVIENNDILLRKLDNVDAVIGGVLGVGRTRISSGAGISGVIYGRDVDYISFCNAYMFNPRTGKLLLTFEYNDSKNLEGRAKHSDVTLGELFAKEIVNAIDK